MKWIGAPTGNRLHVEVRSNDVHAWLGPAGIELPLKLGSNGQWTPESIQTARTALHSLASGATGLGRLSVVCAVGARGVAFRRVTLPWSSDQELPKLLRLQVEAQFPLDPDQLAWGWCDTPEEASRDGDGMRTLLMGAIRRDLLTPYRELFKELDPDPRFVVAALERLAGVSPATLPLVGLDIGAENSEWVHIGLEGNPVIRTIPLGIQSWIRAVRASGAAGEAEFLKVAALDEASWTPAMVEALGHFARELVDAMPQSMRILPLWLSGPAVFRDRLLGLLGTQEFWPGGCRGGEAPKALGKTAANLGLPFGREQNVRGSTWLPRLSFSPEAPAQEQRAVRWPARSRIAGLAGLLLIAIGIPYAEALWRQPGLEERLYRLKRGEPELALIDRKLDFLQYLDQNQSPHLDALLVVARSAPSGAKLESLNLNRQGEVSIGGYLRDAASIGDFRLKLVNSGFFSRVVVEDQAPTPDRQRVNFRMTAQWKDPVERESVMLEEPVSTNLPPGKPSHSGGTTTNHAANTNSSPSSTNGTGTGAEPKKP